MSSSRLRIRTACFALALAASAHAQDRSGPCPELTAFSGVVTEGGPPRLLACLLDEHGTVRASIVAGGALPVPRVVVYSQSAPYSSSGVVDPAGARHLDLDPGPLPRSFDDLAPAARRRLADLLGRPSSLAAPAAVHGPGLAASLPTTPETTVLARFEYDALGRVRTKVGEEGVRHYVYDGDSDRVLAEYDEAGNLVVSRTWAGDRINSITRVGAGTVHPAFDGLGSVAALVDDQGTVVARNQYDAWGNFRLHEESFPFLNSHGFTGHRWEPNLGLYNANARFYDPEVGRFTIQDSFLGEINDPSSLHRYVYAHARPTFFVDPTGRQASGPFIQGHGQLLDWMGFRTREAARDVAGTVAVQTIAAIDRNFNSAGHGSRPQSDTWARPQNDFELAVAIGTDLGVTLAPLATKALPRSGAGPAMARRPGSSAQAETAALVPPDGVVVESHTQLAGRSLQPSGRGQPRVTEDLSSGGEFLDDALRMREQPLRQTTNPLVRANWSQRGIRRDEAFSPDGQRIYSELAGEPIHVVNDLAAAIRNGKIDPQLVEVNYVVREGNVLIENTRTGTALERAGVPRSEWKGRDRTGDPLHEGLVTGQLERNKLTNAGTPTLKARTAKEEGR